MDSLLTQIWVVTHRDSKSKRVRNLLYTPMRGFSVIHDKAIIHYQVYIKISISKKKNYISVHLKFSWYNKKLKPTKCSRDEEIYATIFALVSV